MKIIGIQTITQKGVCVLASLRASYFFV